MYLLVLAVAGAGGVWLLERVIRRTDVGLGLVVALVVVNALWPELVFGVGGLSVHLADVVYGLLFTAGVARLARTRSPSALHLIGLGVLVLIGASFVRGLPEFGLQPTVNAVRDPFYVFGGAMYFATVVPHAALLERLGEVWVAGSSALAGLAVVRWVANAAGLRGGVFGTDDDLRVLESAESLVIAFGLILTLLAQERRGASRHVQLLSAGLLLTIVLLQHRTVWIVTILMIALLVVRRRTFAPRVVAAVAGGVVLASVLFSTVLAGDLPVQDQLSRSATNVDTFEWRIAGWSALFEQNGFESRDEVIFGRPFGNNWDRRVNGLLVRVSPHNFYIETVLRIGVLGLGGLVLLHLVPLARLGRRRPRGRDGAGRELHREGPFLLLAGLPVYYLSYAAPAASAAVIGVAVAVAASRRTRPSTGRSERPPVRERRPVGVGA